MASTVAAGVAPAVEELKTRWASLKNVDPALAVCDLKKAGMSFRRLAKELGCSPSLLRRLYQAAQAPAADLDLARTGQISTRELVRRARQARKQRAVEDKQALDQKRTKAAEKAALTICKWLEENIRWPSQAEAIVDEARHLLAEAEQFDRLPKSSPLPSNLPAAEVIVRMRPSASVNPDVEAAGWYAVWLARWTFFAFPDSVVRDRALNLALDYQIRGTPISEIRHRKSKLT